MFLRVRRQEDSRGRSYFDKKLSRTKWNARTAKNGRPRINAKKTIASRRKSVSMRVRGRGVGGRGDFGFAAGEPEAAGGGAERCDAQDDAVSGQGFDPLSGIGAGTLLLIVLSAV